VVNRVALIVLATVLAASAGAATPVKTWPVTLSQQDRARIVGVACSTAGAAGAESVVASTTRKDSNNISAEVRCKSHATVGKFPVLHYSTCSNAKGTWRCETGYNAVHMTLSNSSVVPVRPMGVTEQVAIEAITEGSKQIVPPFHHPAVDLMRGQCSVSPHPKSPSPEMTLFDITCTGTYMLLTRHCWTGGCRYFISEGKGY
jgi:hypothetical protein